MQSNSAHRPRGNALAEARAAGIGRSGLIVMARSGDPAATRAQNDQLLAEVAASGGRLYPVASVHPADGQAALDELDRLAALGVRWIKLHPNTQRFDVADAAVQAVVARTAHHRMVVLLDGFSPFDANQAGKVLTTAVKQPRARLVLAHFGGPRFDELMTFALLNQFAYYKRNIWFDMSAMAHLIADSPYEAQWVWLARQIGIDRILFGSDFPVETPAHAVEDVRRLGFTAEEQRRIFHDNAAALLAAP